MRGTTLRKRGRTNGRMRPFAARASLVGQIHDVKDQRCLSSFVHIGNILGRIKTGRPSRVEGAGRRRPSSKTNGNRTPFPKQPLQLADCLQSRPCRNRIGLVQLSRRREALPQTRELRLRPCRAVPNSAPRSLLPRPTGFLIHPEPPALDTEAGRNIYGAPACRCQVKGALLTLVGHTPPPITKR